MAIGVLAVNRMYRPDYGFAASAFNAAPYWYRAVAGQLASAFDEPHGIAQ